MPNPSTNAILRVGLITLLVFTVARYSFDSLLLPLMGRSLSGGGDFVQYYIAAHTLRAHKNIYDLAAEAEVMQTLPHLPYKNAGYLYPPLLAIGVVPLTYLPFQWAYRIWVLLQQFVLVAVVLLMARILTWLGRAALPIVILLAGNFYPLYQNMDIGQVNLVILLTLCAALYFARRDQFFWAGVLIAVGTMLKVSPVLLMGLFILQRQWRALWGFAIGMIVLLAVSVAVTGIGTMTSFVTVSLGGSIPAQIQWVNNASLAAFIFHLTHGIGAAFLERPLWYASVVLILGALVWVSYKKRAPSGLEFALLFCTWVAASLLVAPITWEHHLVLLLLPLGVLLTVLATMEQHRFFRISVIAFALVYLLLAFENVTLQRAGQWNFGTGWWIFTGDYLRDYFFADVRLLGLVALFLLLLFVFRMLTHPPFTPAHPKINQADRIINS